ncbi:uncharacterized protein LOC129258047 [Lytechinus pictus]|uniref:uncharacterized protein LOC129258047 n=1 Tax=Lytechinus pictus TaxID=7653 RepID=UPI0030B9F014
MVRMKEIARSHVWWPRIDYDIEQMVKSCQTCQQTRNVPTVATLMPWVWPQSPWTRIHIDYAQKDKKDYLVITDAYSKWPEVIMMYNIGCNYFSIEGLVQQHATTGQTPAGLFLGRELRTRLSLVRPSTKDKVINKQSDQKLHHDKQHGLREFFPGDRVLVKDFRQDETWWSGTVAERRAPKSYVVILEDGRVWKRHVDQLRSECKVSMDDSTHTQVPTPSAHVGPTETLETERHLSAPESLEGNHSPIQAGSQIEDDPDIMPPNSGEVLPLRRSKRVRKTPDRLIESM